MLHRSDQTQPGQNMQLSMVEILGFQFEFYHFLDALRLLQSNQPRWKASLKTALHNMFINEILASFRLTD